MIKFIYQTTLSCILILCFSIQAVAQSKPKILVKQIDIQNFGEPNLSKLVSKMALVKAQVAPPDSVLRITQLGDSHTAADMMTGYLRAKLQEQFGSSGIGWISPMSVYGQRNALISYKNTGWELISSRTTKDPDYPLGGFIAKPTSTESKLALTYNDSEKSSLWNATFLVKQKIPGQPLRIVDGMNYETILETDETNQWQYINTYIMFPFSIISGSAESVELGGIWLEKNGASGITVSPIATNGARQNIWARWRPDWVEEDLAKTKSDLVIIAYGTNESFEANFNIANYKQTLISNIQKIRAALPNTTILILAAPDALVRSKVKAAKDCQAKLPPSLSAIKEAQLEVAKQTKTLYWNWQQAMGGPCSMAQWSNNGLGAKDFVHLTAQGYQQSADSFYNALIKLINKS